MSDTCITCEVTIPGLPCFGCGRIAPEESTMATPTSTWKCGSCGATVERYRGQSDVACTCGAQYNASGQRLRDDWRGNRSNWDDEVGDLEGFEQQYAGDE